MEFANAKPPESKPQAATEVKPSYTPGTYSWFLNTVVLPFEKAPSPVTCPALGDQAARLLHGALGLSTECIELVTETDHAKSILEVADMLWFSALIADALGVFPPDDWPNSYKSEKARTAFPKIDELCSRIKAGFAYGTTTKASDTADWRPLAREVFLELWQIASQHGAQDRLLRKLTKRRAESPDMYTTRSV